MCISPWMDFLGPRGTAEQRVYGVREVPRPVTGKKRGPRDVSVARANIYRDGAAVSGDWGCKSRSGEEAPFCVPAWETAAMIPRLGDGICKKRESR